MWFMCGIVRKQKNCRWKTIAQAQRKEYFPHIGSNWSLATPIRSYFYYIIYYWIGFVQLLAQQAQPNS